MSEIGALQTVSTLAEKIIHIGNAEAKDGDTDIIDSSNLDETVFGDGTVLEYTTNSITYFADELNIVIDITGKGVTDTCNKHIRIRVNTEDRTKWVSSIKVYRFWKLRVKLYTAADDGTMSYIVSEAKERIPADKAKFQSFYCKTVITSVLDWNSSQCEIPKESCEGALGKKMKYDEYFEMDLGAFWNDTAKALVNGLECTSCGGTSAMFTQAYFLGLTLYLIVGRMML